MTTRRQGVARPLAALKQLDTPSPPSSATSGGTDRPASSTLSPLSPISPWPPEISESSTPVHSSDASSSHLIQQTSTLPTAKEVYGSLAVLLTYIAGGLYLLWAFAPEGWLDQWGWTWYPDREWAVVVPAYLMFLVLLTYWSYAALTAYNTPNFASPNFITDPFARIPPNSEGDDPYYWQFADEGAVPQAVDLPIDLVNRVLYPPRIRPRPR